MKTADDFTQRVSDLDAQLEREQRRQAKRSEIGAAVFLGLLLAVIAFWELSS